MNESVVDYWNKKGVNPVCHSTFNLKFIMCLHFNILEVHPAVKSLPLLLMLHKVQNQYCMSYKTPRYMQTVMCFSYYNVCLETWRMYSFLTLTPGSGRVAQWVCLIRGEVSAVQGLVHVVRSGWSLGVFNGRWLCNGCM